MQLFSAPDNNAISLYHASWNNASIQVGSDLSIKFQTLHYLDTEQPFQRVPTAFKVVVIRWYLTFLIYLFVM
jgi:hypothetical protein